MVFVCQLNVLWYTYNLNLASIVTRESWMNLGYLTICIVLLLWILYCWSKSFKMNFLLLEDVSCNDKFLFLYQQQWCKYYHYKWLLFPMAFCFPALLPAVSSVLCLVVRGGYSTWPCLVSSGTFSDDITIVCTGDQSDFVVRV